MGGGVIILRLIKRADFWFVLVAGLLLVGALVLRAGAGAGSQTGAGTDPADVAFSTYSTGPHGLKGLYTFLEARQVSVDRWRMPLTRLGPQVRTLVVWQPTEPEPDEWDAVRTWVEQGGVLIISPNFSAENLAPDPRLNIVRYSREGADAVRPAAASPLMLGVDSLQAGAWYLIGGGNHPSVEVLAADRNGQTAIAAWAMGKGRIYMVADPGLLTNATLPARDNLTFAVNLLGDAPGTVYFDEYHHGAQVGRDWWQTLRPQLRWTMLQATLAALILLVLAGARFGREVEVAEGISRQAAEFAHGLAHLLRESRANRWVRDRLHRAFRQDLVRYLGAPAAAGPDELGRLWELHTGEPAAPLVELLRASAPDGPPRPADRDLLAMVRRMAQYRRRTGYRMHDAQTQEEEGQS